MLYKKGKRCEVEGCCVPSKKYCKPESLFHKDKPDTIYPSLWREAYHVILFLPSTLAIFCYDLYSHLILKQPRRPTWDFRTTVVVAILHAIRASFRNGSLMCWRLCGRIPYQLSAMDRYVPAPFVVKKLGLPGILGPIDIHESGTREIGAHWLLPLEKKADDNDDKIIFYLHGGGYCAKDWQAYLYLNGQLSKYTKRPVFC